MPDFSVGDRVVVVTRKWDTARESQFGITGTISRVYSDPARHLGFSYEVHLDEKRKNSDFLNYCKEDLLYWEKPHFAMETDIDLDEIHRFQEIVNNG